MFCSLKFFGTKATNFYQSGAVFDSCLLLSVSSEQVLKSQDIVDLIFYRKDSKRAARALLSWLRGKGGRCTKQEMSSFAGSLDSGELGFQFSEENFYRGVLKRFRDLGLIAEEAAYDPMSRSPRRSTRVYRMVRQPIPQHRPLAPSFAYVSHLFCERWNEQFVQEVTA